MTSSQLWVTAVDRAVGPAAEQGADEALRLPVCPWPVGTGAQVFEPQRFAGERVDRGAVGGAVVGHQPLDPDPEGGEVGNRAAQKADRGQGLLIVEDFNVDEPGRVVDADVDVFPAEVIRPPMVAAAGDAAGDAVARPSDPAELLDIDVDELASTLFLVAVRRLEWLQPPELAQPDPGQDPRDRRGRHSQRLGDLVTGQPQPAQRRDHSDTRLACAQRYRRWRRAPIQQTQLAFLAEAAPPLRDRTHAHASGLGRRRERPTLSRNPLNRQATAVRTGPRVSVQLHPDPLLGAGRLAAPASKETRMEQRSQELQLVGVNLRGQVRENRST